MGGNKLLVRSKALSLELLENFMQNLSDDVDCKGKPTFRKVFVRGHVYEFSPKAMCEFLNVPIFDFDAFDKDYDMDNVATGLLGIDSKWPGKKTLKVSNLTLKYVGLHKVAITNWWPTSHYPTISEDFVCFMFDVGTGVKVNLGQIMFEFIVGQGNG